MAIRPSGAFVNDVPLTAWEFFAGGGLAGLGLDGFEVTWANDIDPGKGRAFVRNHPNTPFTGDDVWQVRADDLPGSVDLAWASSPCQDLSLAGSRQGLTGRRSGAFWAFWHLVRQARNQGRGPRAVVLENVMGLLTSSGGQDFQDICQAMVSLGYQVGALQLDARFWLPQSRPRLFVVALEDGLVAPQAPAPRDAWHGPQLVRVQASLPEAVRAAWCWWTLPEPALRASSVADLLLDDRAADWFNQERTGRVLALLSPKHRERLADLCADGRRRVAMGYVRVRRDGEQRRQCLELRIDGLAGCLRTPAGGSSRQYVLVCEAGEVRLRYLTAREAARLMGVSDRYVLPTSEAAGLKLMGDGVAVPVVRALAEGLLAPVLRRERFGKPREAAGSSIV